LEDFLKNAENELAKIVGFAETTRKVVEDSAEFRNQIAIVLTDVHEKLAEITTVATQAVVANTKITDNQTVVATKADNILADAQAKLAEIIAVATQAVAANTKITDNQAVVATKSEHIQQAQEHADKVRADLDRALTAATQQVTAAEGQKGNAQAAAENASELLANIRTTKGAVDSDAAAVSATRKVAEESSALTKALAKVSEEIESRIAKYENQLEEIDKLCATQLKTIEELLRGATSAGLASAFDKRRQTFLKPHNRWQWIFVSSVILLVALAGTGFWHVVCLEKVPEWGELARLWLARVPIAGALIWLALHASREAALAKRLEEDYGYKAAIASCFEGFRKQMSEIDNSMVPNSQLAKLCGNTLATIASPPGRIYNAHKLVVSPTDEIADAAKAVGSVASSMKP
jgi:hypothetical protein